jgi:homoserine O-succinyltransferase
MPIVAHNDLPTFQRLREEGQHILEPDRALHQDIRELHIGLLNMMPDAALAATERQFFRLVGQSNPIAQFYVHPFTLEGLERSPEARTYVECYYEPFDPLIEVIEWASQEVTSTLCSCLATHAVLQFQYGQRRYPLPEKRWGVYSHRVVDRTHPLVHDVNTQFDVPHSRFNEVGRHQFDVAGLWVLAESAEAGVHLAVSTDGFRQVFFQGHPEYDTISLLKEFHREVKRFAAGSRPDYPPFPEGYIDRKHQAILDEHRGRVVAAMNQGRELPAFPEAYVAKSLDNTWHDTAEGVVGNWMGLIYQITNSNRKLPFMDGVNPRDPLRLGRG